MANDKYHISCPNSNIYISGFGHDINGNSVIRIRLATNSRGFSIQMNGNLPKTYYIAKGNLLKTKGLTASEVRTIEKEVANYIKEYGSDTQKKKLRIYN